MSQVSYGFYLPESLGSPELFYSHFRDSAREQAQPGASAENAWIRSGQLEDRLKSQAPALLIDLGTLELFEQVAAGSAKKSQRFLECCPYPTRLVVDLRPYVLAPMREQGDLDLWDAVGKQLAWRLSAHKGPVALVWEVPPVSLFKPLAILRDSLELWSGPELLHHNEPKPPEGGAIPIRKLCELLKI